MSQFFIPLVIGLLVGSAAAWLAMRAGASRLATQVEERDRRIQELQATLAQREEALRAAGDQRAALEARLARTCAQLEAAERQAEEKLALLNEARARLEETFKALAGETLKANSESFIRLARSHLETLVAQEDGSLEKRRESIEKLLAPLSDSLKRYEENLRLVEKARGEAYAGLREQAGALADEQKKLQRETANLVNALRQPQTRGRWGELTLHRTVELAGMAEHCDFSEQVSVSTEEGGSRRPDMVIHLPANREIVVDSKVSLNAYLEALDAPSEEEREEKLVRHAAQVRAHMDGLASKEYSRQFAKAPEFVVLFLPGEPFFGAAAQHDPALIEDGMKNDVIIATPTTLVALLRAVARGWRQVSLEENARKISEVGRELYDRAGVVFKHLDEVGGALERAMDSYSKAVGSINSRLLPAARRLKELGATSAADLSAPEPAEGAARTLELPEREKKDA